MSTLATAKRPRSPSPTPSDGSSEATTSVALMECVPCTEQDADVEADARRFACDQLGCEYKAKEARHIRTHKALKHDIDVVWHPCDQPGCESKFKLASILKTHKAHVHNIDVTWHVCDQPGCAYRAKRAEHLKQHKAGKHDIGVVWYPCDHPGCEHKAKRATVLKQHKADVHDIGVTWYACDQSGCEYKSKQASNLATHKIFKHNTGVVWLACDQPGCESKFKRASNLARHKADSHHIDVTWHACDQPGCQHKAKRANHIKQHKADVHDIGVVWHTCDADPDKCDYRAKQLVHLHEHIKRCHARVYAQRKQEQEERVRRALLGAGWQEHRLAEAMPPVGFFRREKRVDFKCAKLESRDTYARVDFVLGVPGGFVFLEVDENQHRYGYGAELSCDMKRMACVMESLAVETNYDTPPIYWLRYNPHAWHVGGELRRVPKADREARLVAWLKAFACDAPFGIGYAFYDCEASGALDVLGNEEYNRAYAEVVDNLMDFGSGTQ